MTNTQTERSRTEKFVYAIVSVCTFVGVSLCAAGLLVPNWVHVTWKERGVRVEALTGLWLDEVCHPYNGCVIHWRTQLFYELNRNIAFQSRNVIRGVETVGVFFGVIALVTLLPFWKSRFRVSRTTSQAVFFFTSLVAAFTCIIGIVVLSKEADFDEMGLGPCLSGSGSALILLSAILFCVRCRYDAIFVTQNNQI